MINNPPNNLKSTEFTQNVFVFGAGASFHAGGPLTQDFIERGFDYLCNNELYAISTDSFFRVVDLIDILYGTKLRTEVEYAIENNEVYLNDPSILRDISIEDLLSFVDLGSGSGDNWLPYEQYRNDLHSFIFETLQTATTHSDYLSLNQDGTIDHRRNCYDRLVDYGLDLDDANCFVTFNYDLLLDKAVSINNHRILGDYNLPFRTVSNFSSYNRIREGGRRKGDVDILKLHGSLNWARCLNCYDLHLAFHHQYERIPTLTCEGCGSKVAPVLIPPILRKDIAGYGIESLWVKAQDHLSLADRIIIVGYSFPDADIESKWLFKRAVAMGVKKPHLTLVEPSVAVRNKITKLFGKTVSGFDFYKSFEEFCDQNAQPE